MGEGLLRQGEARGVGNRAAGLDLVQHRRVVLRIGEHADAALLVAVVLGRGAHHGRAADVDVLDGVVQRAAGLGHRLAEGIEIHHHQVDRRDAVLGHDRQMLGQVAPAEDAAMHLGMQGLDPAVEHFGKAGVVGDVGDGEAGVAQQLGGAAGGKQLDAELGQAAGKINRAALVGNADERLGDFHETSGNQSNSCSTSMRRRVPRLMPSISAATVWLPSACFMTTSSIGRSTHFSTMS
jgi:hypothetical protein